MLSVPDAGAAIAFYKQAFGAEINWTIGEGADGVAGMNIGGADFFLAKESPPHGNRSPSSAGFTTVRVELFVDDPKGAYDRAIAAGAKPKDPVKEHQYPMQGPKPIARLLQGALWDPFGHIWLVGKILN